MTEQTIFSQVAALDPAERPAFLSRSCGGDEDLRSRVEALLECQGSLGTFLETPALLQGESEANTPADLNQALATCEIPRPDVRWDFLAPSQRADSLGRLGHYEVLNLVGRGGMGMVLRAFDEKLHRVVALKVVSEELAGGPLGRKRFIREAIAAAQVSHENVVQIHAVADEGTVPYLVMQYIEGQSLEELLKQEGSLDVKEIVRIGMQIASGLAAAHKQGLIHRDIKPGNILLENGVQRVKITDFGLARATNDATVTQSGMIAGTPQYMSPEQAQDYPIDHRSDLFSLGCVMYAMCAGRPPFRGTSAVSVLRRLCEDPPRPIQEINPEIPDWLCEMILKLLAKQPAERYQSAQELVDSLGQHLARLQQHPRAEQGSSAAVVAVAVQPTPTSSWRRVLAAALAAVAIVAAVIFIQTDRGQFSIETDDPDISFRVTRDGVKLEDRKEQREYDLRVAGKNSRTGEYELEVDDKLKGFGLTTKTFTIKRGERVVLKAEVAPQKPHTATIDAPPVKAEEDGWKPLFNGKDLAGWRVISADPEASWTVKDGVLRGSGPPSFLATDRDTFANFHLRAELKVNAGGDSGMYFRTAFPGAKQDPPNIAPRGYEAQILGHTGIGSGTGAIFWISPIAANVAPQPEPGDWFTLELIAQGNRLRTKLNGQLAAEVVDSERRAERGQFALQLYSSETVLECRMLQIQELPDSETSTVPLAVAPFDERQARQHQEAWAKRLGQGLEMTNSLGMKLRLIPPGEFLMGSPEGESVARAEERPQHTVRLTKPFYAGIHEVTVGQFRAFVEETGYQTDAEKEGAGSWYLIDLPGKGRNPEWTWRSPGFEQTDDHPACCVSWLDAERFCGWLSAREHQLYHLPTEAQWEYACRAGTATPYYFGDELDPSRVQVRAKGTAPVGSYAANAFGLFDTLGNAYEWCHDGRRKFDPAPAIDPAGPIGKGIERVVRGGAWTSTPTAKSMATRAAARFVTCAADRPFHGLGFRVVLLPEVKTP